MVFGCNMLRKLLQLIDIRKIRLVMAVCVTVAVMRFYFVLLNSCKSWETFNLMTGKVSVQNVPDLLL